VNRSAETSIIRYDTSRNMILT